jgi:hypothetical protein
MGAKRGDSGVLQDARHESDDSVRIRFADGREGVVSLGSLGVDVNQLRLATVRPSQDGAALQVTDTHNNMVSVASSILRASLDEQHSDALATGLLSVFPPNQLLLRVLAEMNAMGKDMNPVEDNQSLDYLRKARDGGMYGSRAD